MREVLTLCEKKHGPQYLDRLIDAMDSGTLRPVSTIGGCRYNRSDIENFLAQKVLNPAEKEAADKNEKAEFFKNVGSNLGIDPDKFTC
jgi:hypothetical protein